MSRPPDLIALDGFIRVNSLIEAAKQKAVAIDRVRRSQFFKIRTELDKSVDLDDVAKMQDNLVKALDKTNQYVAKLGRFVKRVKRLERARDAAVSAYGALVSLCASMDSTTTNK